MSDRSNSLLKVPIILSVLVVAFCAGPGSPGSGQTDTAIIKVSTEGAARDLFARFGVTLLDSIPELNKYLVKGDAGNMGKLRKDTGVLSIEDDLVAEISERAILNEATVALLDPATVALLDEQDEEWQGQNSVRSSMLRQAGLQKIRFEQSDVLSGDPTTVAVIDTGLQGSGRATLGQAIVAILNPATVALLDPSVIALMNRRPSPYFGHGTLVSGLIHAIAPRALIMPLKVFDASGRGTSFRIAKAIVYATANGARVINMSFSLETFSPLVDDALDYAARQNMVLVASIGNNNSKVDRNYPASSSKVVGVAATDLNDRKAVFSNYGPAADVAAPGEALISAYPAGLYALWSGTSAAAALVSGEAALLLSRKELKADDVTKRILDGVDRLRDRYDLGKGRINLKSALHKL